MIVVDTSVWAAFFNGQESDHTRRLDAALQAGDDLGLIPVILTEVLQGFRTEAGFSRARDSLEKLPVLTLDLDGHIQAARLFRTLRGKGVTIRGAVDCIIAQSCIVAEALLLSADRDFKAISGHTPLRLCKV